MNAFDSSFFEACRRQLSQGHRQAVIKALRHCHQYRLTPPDWLNETATPSEKRKALRPPPLERWRTKPARKMTPKALDRLYPVYSAVEREIFKGRRLKTTGKWKHGGLTEDLYQRAGASLAQ